MDVTDLLNRAAAGETAAANQVLDYLETELRRIASSIGRPGDTLSPTALINEAYLRVANRDGAWESRAHFLGYAAKAMRSVYVDHVRARRSRKRGGDRSHTVLTGKLAWFREQNVDVLALHEAMDTLARHSPRMATLVELRFFGGLDLADAARAMGISRATASRDWAVARARLYRALHDEERPD